MFGDRLYMNSFSVPRFRAPLAFVNRLLGRLLLFLGYSIERSYRAKQCTLPLLEVVFAALSSTCSEITILQIGAFDGGLSSPLRKILLQANVRALLVEPQPIAYEALLDRFRKHPAISTLQAVVSDQDGYQDLFVPEDSAPSQLASLYRHHVVERSERVRCLRVPSVTIKTLLAQLPFPHISLLQVDAEGSDALIINQFLDLSIFPDVINFESFHLPMKQRHLLMERLGLCGYQMLDYGLDTLAVKGPILGRE